MTAEQDGLDPATVKGWHWCEQWVNGVGYCVACSKPGEIVKWPCLPYRLAALALDLQGKVAARLGRGLSGGVFWCMSSCLR